MTAPIEEDDRPTLRPRDVKWRVDSNPKAESNGKWSARFVAWLPQEVLADMLDEWVGPHRWCVSYQPDGKAVWCTITVAGPTGHPVSKTDVGTADDIKAGTTDAFKRCATRMWGIGREVRQVPMLWAPCRTYTVKGQGGKPDKTVGVPNNETRVTLDRKLADLGFAGWSAEPENGPDENDPEFKSDGPQESAPPHPTDDGIDEDADEIQRLLGALHVLIDHDAVSPARWRTWKHANKGWTTDTAKIREAIDWAHSELAAAGAEPFDTGEHDRDADNGIEPVDGTDLAGVDDGKATTPVDGEDSTGQVDVASTAVESSSTNPIQQARTTAKADK